MCNYLDIQLNALNMSVYNLQLENNKGRGQFEHTSSYMDNRNDPWDIERYTSIANNDPKSDHLLGKNRTLMILDLAI
jgi:hypothetical protein